MLPYEDGFTELSQKIMTKDIQDKMNKEDNEHGGSNKSLQNLLMGS